MPAVGIEIHWGGSGMLSVIAQEGSGKHSPAPVREPGREQSPRREPPDDSPTRKDPPDDEPPRKDPDEGDSPIKVEVTSW